MPCYIDKGPGADDRSNQDCLAEPVSKSGRCLSNERSAQLPRVKGVTQSLSPLSIGAAPQILGATTLVCRSCPGLCLQGMEYTRYPHPHRRSCLDMAEQTR